jgi:hypothetical protein
MLEVVQVPKEQMDGKFLEDLHKSIFGHELPSFYFRYDLCLIAKNEQGELVTYALLRELSCEAIEMAWGGTSNDHRGFATKTAMEKFTEKCFEFYDSVVFQTWNKNTKMIKLGLALGYTIIGTRLTDDGDLMVLFNKRREQ